MPELRNLILVPGHAPFRAEVTSVPSDLHEDYWWALQDFQRGEPPAYIEHIEAGVTQLWADIDESMLIFSGGRTRQEGGRWSEAATYNAIAAHFGYWATSNLRRTRIAGQVALEPFARDSLENLAYSIDTFAGRTLRQPANITIVGWKFKEERFLFHAKTLGFTNQQVRYVGVNDPVDPVALAKAHQGEEATLRLFREDPWARQEPLRSKRSARNPFGVARPSGPHPIYRQD